MGRLMSIFILFPLLAIMAACGGGGLDPDDYAEECGEWVDDYRYDINSERDWENAIDDWNAIKPPGELKRLHELRGESLKLGFELFKEYEELEDELDDLRDEMEDARRSERREIEDEMDDLRDDLEDRTEDMQDELEDLQDEIADEEDDLPRRLRRTLSSEDCSF